MFRVRGRRYARAGGIVDVQLFAPGSLFRAVADFSRGRFYFLTPEAEKWLFLRMHSKNVAKISETLSILLQKIDVAGNEGDNRFRTGSIYNADSTHAK